MANTSGIVAPAGVGAPSPEISSPSELLRIKEDHNRSLDGLRFFSFLAVFAGHAFNFYPMGGYGTRVFFVLSGFLIGRILLKQRKNNGALGTKIRTFYIRRTLRIFPLYYAVLIAIALTHAAGSNLYPDKALLWQFFYASNYYELLREMPGVTGHLWTLAIEEQFYLLAPVFVLLLPRNKIGIGLTGLWIINILVYLLDVTVWHNGNLRMLSNIQFGFIGMGLAAAYIQEDGSFLGLGRVALYKLGALAGAATLILAVALRRHMLGDNYYLIFEWTLCIASAALVLSLWRNDLGWVGQILALRPLAYLGQISYGLYIYHSFALWTCQIAWGRTRTVKYAALLITIAISAASWHFFEKKINDLKRYFPYTDRAKLGSAAASYPSTTLSC